MFKFLSILNVFLLFMHHMLSSLFASGLALTYSPTHVVPSALTHFTSLFGMDKGWFNVILNT